MWAKIPNSQKYAKQTKKDRKDVYMYLKWEIFLNISNLKSLFCTTFFLLKIAVPTYKKNAVHFDQGRYKFQSPPKIMIIIKNYNEKK